MPFYQWTEYMSVGIPRLDSDHRALIGLINRLHDGLRSEDDADALVGVFDSLIAYAKLHFAREEKVMEACGYPEVEAHRAEHARFTDRIYELRDRYTGEPATTATGDLLEYLKAWLNHHILIQDMAYKAYTEDDKPLAIAAARSFGPGLADDEPAGRPTPARSQ